MQLIEYKKKNHRLTAKSIVPPRRYLVKERRAVSRVVHTLMLLRIALLYAATGGGIVNLNQNSLYATAFLPRRGFHFSARIMQNAGGK